MNSVRGEHIAVFWAPPVSTQLLLSILIVCGLAIRKALFGSCPYIFSLDFDVAFEQSGFLFARGRG